MNLRIESRFLTFADLVRLDADSALNHDLLWSDPMPCSLEKMLANHHQSMFEYNAPTRCTCQKFTYPMAIEMFAEEELEGGWLGGLCVLQLRTRTNSINSSNISNHNS